MGLLKEAGRFNQVQLEMSAKSIMPATEFRKVQTEEASQIKEARDKRDAEFAGKFKAACEKYKQVLLDEVAEALEHAKKRSVSYIILDEKYITADCEGFVYTSLLYGFWDKKSHRFDDSAFAKHSITKPLEAAQKELESLGYKLEDVSDPKRSRRLFLKLSW